MHTLTAFGTHVESNALAMLLCALFLATWWRADQRAPNLGMAFLFGVLAGFAIYFGYIVLLTLCALALARLVRDRGALLRRDTLAAFLGLLVGLAPWLYYNGQNDFAGLEIYGRGIGDELPGAQASPPLSERLADLATRGLPDSAFFRALGPLTGSQANQLYAGALGLALLAFVLAFRSEIRAAAAALLRRPGEPWKLPFAPLLLVQPLLFLAAFACTDFKVGDRPHSVVSYRYVHVLWPWLFLAAGLALDRLLARGALARFVASSTLGLLLALGGLGSLALVDSSRYGSDFVTPGFSYNAFGRFVVMNFDSQPEKIVAALERAAARRAPAELDEFLFGMGMQLKEGLRQTSQVGPRLQAFRARAEGLRQRLQPQVGTPYQPYFESPGADAPPFGRSGQAERSAFWKWYRSRPGKEGSGDATGQ